MKLEQLRKIIRKEVKTAVKEELQTLVQELTKNPLKTEPKTVNPSENQYTQVQKGQPKKWSFGKSATLDEILNQTAKTMSNEDYKNIVAGGGDLIAKPNFANTVASSMGMTENTGPVAGLDISKLGFVNNAKKVLDKSYEKDKVRL